MAHKANFPTLALSVASIIDGTDPVAARIRDRSFPLTAEFVTKVTSLLMLGYPGRRPRSKVDRKGRPRPTDMDLASFLAPLLQKPTVLELPAYTAALPRKEFASDRHLGNRRYGNLLALSSHREYFSFGVTIEDMSIMRRSAQEEDTLGSPRTFLIVSHQGDWHPGWQGVSWQFRTDEEQFRNRYDLVTDSEHRGYQYFVHPNRRHSIFSRAHLLLKLLWQRLDEEIERIPQKENPAADQSTTIMNIGPAKSKMVPTFTMKLTGLPLTGQYQELPAETPEAQWARRVFLARLQTQVQFYVRANEFAFYQYGRTKDYVAHWIGGGAWYHLPSNNTHRRHATLLLARGVALGYTVDLVSKKVAAH